MTCVAFLLRCLAGAFLAILLVSTQAAVAAKRLAPPPNLNGLWARYLSKPAGPAGQAVLRSTEPYRPFVRGGPS